MLGHGSPLPVRCPPPAEDPSVREGVHEPAEEAGEAIIGLHAWYVRGMGAAHVSSWAAPGSGSGGGAPPWAGMARRGGWRTADSRGGAAGLEGCVTDTRRQALAAYEGHASGRSGLIPRERWQAPRPWGGSVGDAPRSGVGLGSPRIASSPLDACLGPMQRAARPQACRSRQAHHQRPRPEPARAPSRKRPDTVGEPLSMLEGRHFCTRFSRLAMFKEAVNGVKFPALRGWPTVSDRMWPEACE